MNDFTSPPENGDGATPVGFADAGVGHVAYIRPVATPQGTGFAIHAANGAEIAIAEDMATAYGFIVQSDLSPVSLH